MSNKRASLGLFLLGTFSMTQVHVIGNIGISELVLFLIAPFVFIQDHRLLKHDGFMTAVWLALLSCCGCVIASMVNHTPFQKFIRGFASPYAVFSILVVGHRLVRNSLSGYKWFCLGLGLTWIINIFVFQRGVEADANAGGARGLAAVEGVMDGTLFWVSRIKAIMQVPISGWYQQIPIGYSILAPVFLFFFSALTTASGRSTAAGAFGSVVLVILGGKKRRQMRQLSKNFWVVVVLGLISAQLLTMGYKAAALKGLLGEQALKKYEQQMKGEKSGVLATLMGGRLEFFVGVYSGLKRPIIGYGPWALDVYGYHDEFLAKYGNADDYEHYLNDQKFQKLTGRTFVRTLGAHSHIIGAWLKHGIFGFLFWLYFICQIIRYFRRDLATVPQWFGMLAVVTPSLLWNIFFSPFGDRVGVIMILVYLLMTKAIRLGKIYLPYEMTMEIDKMERA